MKQFFIIDFYWDDDSQDPELDFFLLKQPKESGKRILCTVFLGKMRHYVHGNHIVSGNWALCENIGGLIHLIFADVGGFHMPLLAHSESNLSDALNDPKTILQGARVMTIQESRYKFKPCAN